MNLAAEASGGASGLPVGPSLHSQTRVFASRDQELRPRNPVEAPSPWSRRSGKQTLWGERWRGMYSIPCQCSSQKLRFLRCIYVFMIAISRFPAAEEYLFCCRETSIHSSTFLGIVCAG